jgi:acetolactate synthase-1/2/3 large subunit
VEEAFFLLRDAERPVALVGSQLFWSRQRDAYLPFVETFGLPVYVNGQARGSLPPDHPQRFSHTRKDALRRADVVIIFGTPLDFRLGYGRETHLNPKAKLIQVDLDGREIGRNRSVDVGIIGDTGMVMAELTDCARSNGGLPHSRPAWLEDLRALENQKLEALLPQLRSDAVPINPLRLCAEISAALPNDSIVIGDGGDFVGSAANIVRPNGFGSWLDAGPLGTLGAGPGYAIAAKLARRDAPVIIVYGDGAFGLHAMEFEAMVRQKINVVGIVGNDAGWTQILRGQAQLYGADRCPASRLAHTRYALVVEALGGHGELVEHPESIRPALERALRAGKPALVNVVMGTSDFRKDAIAF